MYGAVVACAEQLERDGRAIIATDMAGTVLYWGPGAERLYCWERDEALGRNIVELTPSELSRAEAEEIMEILRSGKPWSGEFAVRDKFGNRFMAYVTDIPVHDRRGRLAGIVGSSYRTR